MAHHSGGAGQRSEGEAEHDECDCSAAETAGRRAWRGRLIAVRNHCRAALEMWVSHAGQVCDDSDVGDVGCGNQSNANTSWGLTSPTLSRDVPLHTGRYFLPAEVTVMLQWAYGLGSAIDASTGWP